MHPCGFMLACWFGVNGEGRGVLLYEWQVSESDSTLKLAVLSSSFSISAFEAGELQGAPNPSTQRVVHGCDGGEGGADGGSSTSVCWTGE